MNWILVIAICLIGVIVGVCAMLWWLYLVAKHIGNPGCEHDDADWWKHGKSSPWE